MKPPAEESGRSSVTHKVAQQTGRRRDTRRYALFSSCRASFTRLGIGISRADGKGKAQPVGHGADIP